MWHVRYYDDGKWHTAEHDNGRIMTYTTITAAKRRAKLLSRETRGKFLVAIVEGEWEELSGMHIAVTEF